jgi:hypothetical protein
MPRSVTHGRSTRRESESVGTDSLVLCLDEAFNVLRRAILRKIYSHGKSGGVDARASTKMRANDDVRARGS